MKTRRAETTAAPVFAGIDVSKDSLDLAIIQGDTTIVQCKVENNNAGFALNVHLPVIRGAGHKWMNHILRS